MPSQDHDRIPTKTRDTIDIAIPYEWFEAETLLNQDGQNFGRILIIWIPEDQFREYPIRMLKQLVRTIGKNRKKNLVKILGPSNSTTLMAMLKEPPGFNKSTHASKQPKDDSAKQETDFADVAKKFAKFIRDESYLRPPKESADPGGVAKKVAEELWRLIENRYSKSQIKERAKDLEQQEKNLISLFNNQLFQALDNNISGRNDRNTAEYQNAMLADLTTYLHLYLNKNIPAPIDDTDWAARVLLKWSRYWLPGLTLATKIELFNYRATAPEKLLLNQTNKTESSDLQSYFRTYQDLASYYSLIPKDDQLAEEVLRELKRRGIDLSNNNDARCNQCGSG